MYIYIYIYIYILMNVIKRMNHNRVCIGPRDSVADVSGQAFGSSIHCMSCLSIQRWMVQW